MDQFAVYTLHWIFVVMALTFSWARSRHYLHPHFLITVMFCIFVSDFLVRGYNDQNIEFIPRGNLYEYQIFILIIFSAIIFFASMFRSHRIEASVGSAMQGLHAGPSVRRAIAGVAWALLLFELAKRLFVVDWSISEVVHQSLKPRGQRTWDELAHSGNFFLSLMGIIFPFTGIGFAYLIPSMRGISKLFAISGFVLVLAILTTNGSRTPVGLSLGALWLFWAMPMRWGFGKIVKTVVVVACVASIFSLMVTYRATGYVNDRYNNMERELELVYQQDDSYYRTLFAYDYSENSGKSWDPYTFVFAAITNPIPRALWPGKPTLDRQYFDGFKLDHVTNLFLGEIVAMTGVDLSVVFAVIVGLGLYAILFNGAGLLRLPAGLTAYIAIGLYVYMCMRSLQNIFAFIYLPAFVVIVVVALKKLRGRTGMRRRPVQGLVFRDQKSAPNSTR